MRDLTQFSLGVPAGFICLISCETFDYEPARITGIDRIVMDRHGDVYFDGVYAHDAYGHIDSIEIVPFASGTD